MIMSLIMSKSFLELKQWLFCKSFQNSIKHVSQIFTCLDLIYCEMLAFQLKGHKLFTISGYISNSQIDGSIQVKHLSYFGHTSILSAVRNFLPNSFQKKLKHNHGPFRAWVSCSQVLKFCTDLQYCLHNLQSWLVYMLWNLRVEVTNYNC